MIGENIFLSPSQLRKYLKVEANALKKYVLMLEKAGYTIIEKDSKGHRRYSQYDVITLQNFLAFKESGMSLEDCTTMIIEQARLDGKLGTCDVITVKEPNAYNVMMEQIRQQLKEEIKREILEEMESKYVTHDQLSEQVTMSRKERIEMEQRLQLEQREAEREVSATTVGWIQRLKNIFK